MAPPRAADMDQHFFARETWVSLVNVKGDPGGRDHSRSVPGGAWQNVAGDRRTATGSAREPVVKGKMK
jgi:hypothetical protein